MNNKKDYNTYREINSGQGSPVGQSRRELYRCTLERYAEAMDAGYYLEAVTLMESVIADRLESRIARLFDNEKKHRKFTTLGTLTRKLINECSEPEEAISVYESIQKWSRLRNKDLHQLAKLEEGSSAPWQEKYDSAKSTAEQGKQIFRRLDNVVRVLNS